MKNLFRRWKYFKHTGLMERNTKYIPFCRISVKFFISKDNSTRQRIVFQLAEIKEPQTISGFL